MTPVPTEIDLSPVGEDIESSGTDGQTCVVRKPSPRVDGNELWCWGNTDAVGSGPDGTPHFTPTRVAELGESVSQFMGAISVGRNNICAIKVDGTLWCWGNNDHGQLGNGTTTPSPTPVQVTNLGKLVRWVSVSPTGDFTCAVTAGPDPRAGSQGACWGRNDSGQLGDGTTTERHEPVALFTTRTEPIDPDQIAAGRDHACAHDRDTDAFWCWGANDHGQVGDGTSTDRHAPVRLTFAPPPQVPVAGAAGLALLAVGLLIRGISKRR